MSRRERGHGEKSREGRRREWRGTEMLDSATSGLGIRGFGFGFSAGLYEV